MDELDKQLDKVFLDNGLFVEELRGDDAPKLIEQLKQVFKDAGYIHLPNSQGKSVTIYTSDNPEPLKAGSEWYADFVEAIPPEYREKHKWFSDNVIINAARIASGLGDDLVEASTVPDSDTKDDIKDV